MTTIYFVRHAQPNYDNHVDEERELTKKGLEDRKLVSNYLEDKNIDVVFSSPFKRSVDTVKHFADKHNLSIELVDDFRERRVDSIWIEDFDIFCKNQWSDFSFKLSDGESLKEVQSRNIMALEKVLRMNVGKNIVIGTHGTALSTIINYYDKSFDYDRFQSIKTLMPWIVKFEFDEMNLLEIEEINVFEL